MMFISQDIRYIGVNDHNIDLFEGQYKVPNGMAYNSYMFVDDRIAVMDTVDAAFTHQWLNNLSIALDGRKPDYLVIHHMEPDHSASISAFVEAYPEACVVSNAKAFTMMDNFYGEGVCKNRMVVANNDTLSLGRHTLSFVLAPMVHWPEVMVSYDNADKVLFSADAFGKFGANDIEEPWEAEARRYYFGIVAKYGPQVQSLIKAASAFDISVICSLHGPVLKENISDYIQKYVTWSAYNPDSQGVFIAYTSVYGNTEKAAILLAEELKQRGCEEVELCDLARNDVYAAVANAFYYSKVVFATTTYNSTIFPTMKQFIDHLTERGFQNRTVGLIENGSWAAMATKVMKGMLEKCKGLSYLEQEVTIKSALTDKNKAEIKMMADEISRGVIIK